MLVYSLQKFCKLISGWRLRAGRVRGKSNLRWLNLRDDVWISNNAEHSTRKAIPPPTIIISSSYKYHHSYLITNLRRMNEMLSLEMVMSNLWQCRSHYVWAETSFCQSFWWLTWGKHVQEIFDFEIVSWLKFIYQVLGEETGVPVKYNFRASNSALPTFCH